ncbi:MAG: VOC family protein [Thermosynechococcus sp.]|uniref:VOC family protein n=1 Tax=Thermosynechococcus sp. TaxID=2814275 RepID=UPI00391AD7BB
MGLHHVSIRTANIQRAIAFYECLGFTMEVRFTTGYTLACWLKGWHTRLELLQVPEPQPPADPFHDEHYVGYYHLSFDLSDHADPLETWLNQVAETLKARSLPFEVLLKPTQQVIGSHLYHVAFVRDCDGLPLEFLQCLGSC